LSTAALPDVADDRLEFPVGRRQEAIRIPRLRAFVASLATLAVIGILVFLQRYRGADRTAMALSVLGGAGLCLVVALIRFHLRWSGQAMSRFTLWGIGLRSGAVAGVCTIGVGIVLLAVRWAIDQRAGPVWDPFLPAFFRALKALGIEMARGLPAFVAAGAVVGALVGVAVAEAIGISAERIPPTVPPSAADGDAIHPSNIER